MSTLSTEAEIMHRDYQAAVDKMRGVCGGDGDMKSKLERLREIGAQLDKAIVVAGHQKLFNSD